MNLSLIGFPIESSNLLIIVDKGTDPPHSFGCSLRPGDAFTSQFDAAKLKKDSAANWMKLIKLVDDFHYALSLCAVRVQTVQNVQNVQNVQTVQMCKLCKMCKMCKLCTLSVCQRCRLTFCRQHSSMKCRFRT